MIVIQFETDNAAFDGDKEFEIARILHLLADKVRNGTVSAPIHDINGNKIGTMEITA